MTPTPTTPTTPTPPRASRITVALSLAFAALLVVVGVGRLTGARQNTERAQQRLQHVRQDAERVLTLRATSQTVAAGEQPSQDVFQRVNRLLSETGLSHVRVQSVTPAGDRALDGREERGGRGGVGGGGGGGGHREQTVRVVLAPITTSELGNLLDRWQRTQTLWNIGSIDLLAARGRSNAIGSYTATLSASAVYVPLSNAPASREDPQP
ncbi:MAG: hypothetical protein Q9O74_00965 [Planctomycetota bacterium]|nr:hypothetical protein [Planctomycetota bacterium]